MRLVLLLLSYVNSASTDRGGNYIKGARICYSWDTEGAYIDKPIRVWEGDRHQYYRPHYQI